MATAEPDAGTEPTLASVRAYLRGEFNRAVRWPGMYGGEMALVLYLGALEAAYGARHATGTRASLEQRGAFTSLGVGGAFRQFWPGLESSLAVHAGISEMMASVYAETGRQQGWLDLDRALTRAEFDELTSAVPGWCQQDRTLTEVLAAFGPPSVRGSSNARWPTTILYATDQPADPCLSFHLWNSFTSADGPSATEYPEPMLLAARREGGQFTRSFTLTPLGHAKRSTPGHRRQP